MQPKRASTAPMQPARADLAQLGLGTLRRQAVMEGVGQAQINEALDSDNVKNQLVEMIFQAQSEKVAVAELEFLQEELQLRQELRLEALAKKQQEQQRAAQELRAELSGLRLRGLHERTLGFGITSDLIDKALDDVSDAKQALIELCIEAEFGAVIHQETDLSPSPARRLPILDSPSARNQLTPERRPWAQPHHDSSSVHALSAVAVAARSKRVRQAERG